MKQAVGVAPEVRLPPKGAVIGPLTIGVYAIAREREGELSGLGVKDSKLLAHPVRLKLDKTLREMGEPLVIVISAEELTEKMRRRMSLNELEAKKISEGLHVLNSRVKLARVIVDSPDAIAENFEHRLRKYFDHQFDIVCRNKADRDFPVCGAASILAKVERENQIAAIKGELAVQGISDDFGSGYSHDPQAIAFMAKYHRDERVQSFIRHEWETAKRLKSEQADLSKFL